MIRTIITALLLAGAAQAQTADQRLKAVYTAEWQWRLAQTGQVQSLALLPLREGAVDGSGPAFGLLVLGSPDAQRFQADMGTDFLARIAELASAALSRLR